MSPQKACIVSVYFAITSLTTVGFGDFHPKTNMERLVCSMMLLFGVAIFSFIMDKFIEMLQQTKQFNRSLDDGDNLSKFLGVCERFNDYKPMNMELKRKIESYFKFKWSHDKNQALRDVEDLDIFDQIPDEI